MRAGSRPPLQRKPPYQERTGTQSTTRGRFVTTTSFSSTMTKEYRSPDEHANVRPMVNNDGSRTPVTSTCPGPATKRTPNRRMSRCIPSLSRVSSDSAYCKKAARTRSSNSSQPSAGFSVPQGLRCSRRAEPRDCSPEPTGLHTSPEQRFPSYIAWSVHCMVNVASSCRRFLNCPFKLVLLVIGNDTQAG